jgi:hypothetical protein
MKDVIHIETFNEIRRRQQFEALDKDRDFWQRTAEQLQNRLELICDAAESDGRVTIVQKGKAIKLQIAPVVATETAAK